MCTATCVNDNIHNSKQSEVILCVIMHSNLVQSVKVKCGGGGGGPETNFVVCINCLKYNQAIQFIDKV